MTVAGAISEPTRPRRILEIGDRAIFKFEMPAQTTLYWSGPRLDNVPSADYRLLNGRGVREVRAALRRREYDCVIWHPPETTPWHETLLKRKDFRHWWLYWLSLRLDLPPDIPLVVFDTRDRAYIGVHILPALARARAYFKRELPLDPGRLMPPRALPGHRNQILRQCGRIKPISIGLAAYWLDDLPSEPVPKTADVFFAGQMRTPQRREDLIKLQELGRAGITVDISSSRLSRPEFYRRCAAAWLVWSPEGGGWDCFRHYEAAACGSVPVMSTPTIQRYQPLEDGVHGLYYDSVRRPLTEVILEALSDKERLRRMADAARVHVSLHHTHAALCRLVLEEIYSDGIASRR